MCLTRIGGCGLFLRGGWYPNAHYNLDKTVENTPWKIRLRLPFPYILRWYYITASRKFQICQPHFSNFFEPVQFNFIVLPYSNKKNAVFSLFRSSADGNCLYSSMPLSLFVDGYMKEDLKFLSSCELFLHNNYYCKHPVFMNLQKNITSH